MRGDVKRRIGKQLLEQRHDIRLPGEVQVALYLIDKDNAFHLLNIAFIGEIAVAGNNRLNQFEDGGKTGAELADFSHLTVNFQAHPIVAANFQEMLVDALIDFMQQAQHRRNLNFAVVFTLLPAVRRACNRNKPLLNTG